MNSVHQGKFTQKTSQIPGIFVKYLEKRGIVGDEAVHNFLHPSLVNLPKPDLMQNLKMASQLVIDYMITGRQIIIWGDYDVDGTTGTALLVNFFKEFGIEVRWHIPNRFGEGYGLNSEWFVDQKNSYTSKSFLLITVDCGISNAQEIEVIKDIGGEVIVTDHHSLPEHSIPECLVLNPSQLSCGFHKEQLAGVGVAFYLAAGIRASLSSDSALSNLARQLNLKQYLAFVALGTVADMVGLTATNRILVRAGLEALIESKFIGLRELLLSCDISGDCVSSEDIGYLIGPKINAAGRLGNSEIVVELLVSADRADAKRLSTELTRINMERRDISNENLETALALSSIAIAERNRCIIVKGDLHQGVAGIVASKLVEKFKVPSIVFAKKLGSDGKEYFTGSARSVDGVNIVDLLSQCTEWIDKFGGHEMAAGLTVSEKKIENFEKHFVSIIIRAMNKRQVQPRSEFDIACSVEMAMDSDHLNCFRLLEPFGPGNSQPVFKDSSVTVVNTRAVGMGSEHLQLTIRGRYSNLKGIGFGLGGRISDIQKRPKRDMIYTPTMNRFRGNVSWQVRVIEI